MTDKAKSPILRPQKKEVLVTSPIVIPLTTGRINISLGCYGCRAGPDLSDDLMFMGIPLAGMPVVVQGLGELSKKAIPDSRTKITLPLCTFSRPSRWKRTSTP